ncbi:MAG TPA: ferredoxin [Myxococcota bacterium]
MAKRSASEAPVEKSEALRAQHLEVLSGRQAVVRVERAVCGDALAHDPAVAEGLALAGVRAASVADDADWARVAAVVLPGVSCVHHVTDAPERAPGGGFELAAGSPQQAVDHCLAAHRLSQRLGRAGLCSLAPEFAEQVALLELPGPALRDAVLEAEPEAAEPDAAPERIVELAEQALNALAQRSGRPAQVARYVGDDAAEVVLVASAARAAQIDALAKALSAAGLQAGSLALTLVHPFPIQKVRDVLAGVRRVFVVEEPGRRAGLLAGVRAAAAEKAAVCRLDPAPPAEMLEALEAHWPKRSFDEVWRETAPALPAHRLVLAPAGAWGEEMLCRVAAVLGHLGPLRLGPSVRREAGAVLLEWECEALPEGGADLLVAAAAPLLDTRAALSLVRPKSAVLVVSAAEDSDQLARDIAADARERIRETELRVSWAAAADVEDPRVDAGGDLTFYLAGAALAALRERTPSVDFEAAAARLEQAGRSAAARALRAGAESIHVLEAAALAPERRAEEVDFRQAPALPRMPTQPEATTDAAAWPARVRRFHLHGSGFAFGPQLPLRPAALGSLGEALREHAPHPFALVRGDGPAPVVAARGLRELIGDQLRAVQAAGRAARVLDDNLPRLLGLAAHALAQGELGVDLDGLLTQAGKELAGELALPEEEEQEFFADLADLRRRMPVAAKVFDLRHETPLRVTLEVLDAAREPLRRRFADELKLLREQLRDLIDLDRMASAEGRSPAALAAALGGSPSQRLDAAALANMLPKDSSSAKLDDARRARVSAALAILEKYLTQKGGPPRATVVRPPSAEFAEPAFQAPLEQRVHPDPLGAAVGLFDGSCRRMAELFRAVRAARLDVVGCYEPERHDAPLAELDWEAFAAEELELVPPVVALTSGRRLRQRDQGSLSELLRSSRAVYVVVQDEVGAADEAEHLSQFHVDLGYLVVAHREAFALASTLARPTLLVERLARMAHVHRPAVALYHLPALEPAALRSLLAEAALEGRACPDFGYDPDAGASWADRFDLSGNPQPERLWPVRELPHLTADKEQTLELPLTFADAVAFEPAYLRHFQLIPPAAWDETQVPLAEWLSQSDADARRRSIPYLWVLDDENQLQRAVVTRALALASEDRARGWRVLQELAGYDNVFATRAAQAARAQLQAEAAELERAHAEALARARTDATRASMERLAAALVRPGGIGPLLSGAAPAPAAFTPAAPVVAEAPAAAPAAAAAPAVAQPAVEGEAGVSDPYIDSALCTTCNECTKLNGQLFKYNAEKQAYIADASAGTFKQLVKAAELCPARCIHPGKPRPGDSTATPQLIERAAKYN